MNAANQFVDIMKDLAKQERLNSDQVELCQVVTVKDPAHCGVRPVADLGKGKLVDVVNMTRFDVSPGDLCYVYKINNNFANAFICYTKGKTTQSECRMISKMIEEAVAPLREQIESLQREVTEVIITETLPSADQMSF